MTSQHKYSCLHIGLGVPAIRGKNDPQACHTHRPEEQREQPFFPQGEGGEQGMSEHGGTLGGNKEDKQESTTILHAC